MGPMIVVAAETGLRPQELADLEWRDIQGGVVVVERTFSADSGLRSYGKTERSVRRVPLTERGRVALRETPRRIDMPAVFASPRSPRVDRHNFRSREWLSALVGAKIEKEDHRGRHRRIYDLRHTYASNVLAGGSEPVGAFTVHGHERRVARQDVRASRPGRGRTRHAGCSTRTPRGSDFSRGVLAGFCPRDRDKPEKPRERTTGLEPATLGLGSQCSTN